MTGRIVIILYDALKKHRTGMLLSVAIFIAACVFAAITAPQRNDISVMIPDSGQLAEDFALLQQSPLTGKIIINLHAETASATKQLGPAAVALAQALPGPLISTVVDGPQEELGPALISWLVTHAPSLLNDADLKKLEEMTTPTAIEAAMQHNYRDLLSPQGSALKSIIRMDPLGIRTLLFPKLKSLSLSSSIRIKNDHFMSESGTDLLLIAETPVPMTDSDGSSELIAHLETTFTDLPTGITATYTAGHRHTLANASIVQSDIRLALGLSLALLVAIFCIFLRRARAIIVFLVPGCVLAAALACTRFGYDEISGIVLGFGAVLIGISIDFALHVYFACSGPDSTRANSLQNISRPLLFSTLTSLGAFGALMLSSIPAIRQLAMFTIYGLSFSLLLSLVVLPHLLGNNTRIPPIKTARRIRTIPKGLYAGYILFLLVCLAFSLRVHVDGDLRSLGYMHPKIVAEENVIRSTWGGLDTTELVFTPAGKEEPALEANDATYKLIKQHSPDTMLSSLAPLVPSPSTQQQRIADWQAIWSSERLQTVTRAIDTEASKYGFSAAAFEPFKILMAEIVSPITINNADEAGLGEIIDLFLVPQKDMVRLLTILPESVGANPAISTALEQFGMRKVSSAEVKRELEQGVRDDSVRFLGTAALIVLLLLILLFRNLREVFAAALPPICAAVVVMGLAGMTGNGLNLFSITAFPIVLGLCADYGIFMVHVSQGKADVSARKATLVSGLTTLAGFGTLALTTHPALKAMGTSVLFGVGAALPAALFLTPAVTGRKA